MSEVIDHFNLLVDRNSPTEEFLAWYLALSLDEQEEMVEHINAIIDKMSETWKSIEEVISAYKDVS